MKNTEIAEIFEEIADVLELQEVEWKPRAYRNAARGLRDAEDVEKVLKKQGKKGLKKISGVGESIADKIVEYIKKGKISEYEKLRKKVPKGVLEMMDIMGLGPKKAWKLYREEKIKSVRELENAAKKGEIRKIEGFGKKSEEDILKGIKTYKRAKGRFLLGNAWPIAQDIVSKLKKHKNVSKAELAGSLRRKKETIGDIDILVISKKPKEVMDFFTKLPGVERVLAKGETKSSVVLKEGLNCDLRVLEPKNFGAAMMYFTGSKQHNIELRKIAIKKGFKLSEYGLFRDKKLVAGRTEEEVYKKLGLKWIPPEIRQNTGEIEAAKKGKLPKLVPYGSIKGDLQMHTKWSDGKNTQEEMINACIKMGYKYVAITDHSKSQHIAGGMSEKQLAKYIDKMQELKKKYKGKIKVLIGSEVDILPDGSLDYSDKYLKKLDWVLIAVHSKFKMSKKAMTDRIIRAMQNKQVSAVAHPTGRKIGVREPFNLDLDRFFSAAKENKVLVEIDAQPARLDLNDSAVRKAVENNVKLIIDTDAHSTQSLKFMEFGIAQARRGWAEEKDIANTLPWSRFKKYLKR